MSESRSRAGLVFMPTKLELGHQKKAFLEAFRLTGNVSQSAAAAGVSRLVVDFDAAVEALVNEYTARFERADSESERVAVANELFALAKVGERHALAAAVRIAYGPPVQWQSEERCFEPQLVAYDAADRELLQ